MAIKVEFRSEVLRTLHHIQQQLGELQSELERGPRKIKAGETLVQQAFVVTETARATLKQTKIQSDQRELQLKSREAKIEKLKGKLNSAASNREFDLLKEQIAADVQANAVLSDEILEGLEKIDELELEVKAADDAHQQAESEHKKRVSETEARMAQVSESLEHMNSRLEESEAEIPPEALSEYKRLTAARGAEALAPVEDNSCGGCYQTLTTQMIEQLRMSRMVRCASCSAFIYLPS